VPDEYKDDRLKVVGDNLKEVALRLNSVGWFIPPYVSVGFLDLLSTRIAKDKAKFTQDDLETYLARIYGPQRLASMILSRYPEVPVIADFKDTISEAVQAHFMGLGHIAVGGLVPVIEGAGRRISKLWNLKDTGPIEPVFMRLAKSAKVDVKTRRIGAVDEIINMLDSFTHFIGNYFYEGTQAYPLQDRTNRNGITHGTYADADYGKPINFYKTIAAIDFLTFVSSLKTNEISGFVPNETTEAKKLALRYLTLSLIPPATALI
jgi:hypothetical protein